VANPPQEQTYSNDEAKELYYRNRTGPWTISGPTCFGFIPFVKLTDKWETILNTLEAQIPDAYLPANSHATVIAGYARQMETLKFHLATDFMAASEVHFENGFMVSQQHPFSRGFTRIKSSDPFEDPIIDLRYHTNPLDFDIAAEAIRFTRRVMSTEVMLPLGFVETSPGPAATSDKSLKTFTSSKLSTGFDSCCTNPMQALEEGGVVDYELRVYGATNLR
jgi:choline dehydrogenase